MRKKRNTSVRKPIWRTHAPIHTILPKIKRARVTAAERNRKERTKNSNVKIRCCSVFFICSYFTLYYIIAIAVIVDIVVVVVVVVVIVRIFFGYSFLFTASRFVCMFLLLSDFFTTTYGLHDLVQLKNQIQCMRCSDLTMRVLNDDG